MTRYALVPAALFLCAAASLNAAIDAPKVGVARQADGTIHSLYGLHANFIYGAQMFSFAQAASFSDQAGLISVRGEVQLISAGTVVSTFKANEASPVLNVDGDASTAIAWLPGQRALLFNNNSSFTLMPVGDSFLGTVTSLLRQGSSAQLLVTAADSSVYRVEIDLNSGITTNIQYVPVAQGGVFSQQSFLVFHDAAGLEVMAADGSLRTLPLAAADLTFERLSSAWVHLHSASLGQDWALHLDSNALELSELPATPAVAPIERRPLPDGTSPMTPVRGVAR